MKQLFILLTVIAFASCNDSTDESDETHTSIVKDSLLQKDTIKISSLIKNQTK